MHQTEPMEIGGGGLGYHRPTLCDSPSQPLTFLREDYWQKLVKGLCQKARRFRGL